MADRLAKIAMDTGASIQVQATYARGVITEAAAFLDNDVNHWLEASQAEHYELQGPAMTASDLIISRQDCAQRHSAVRGLVLPNLQVSAGNVVFTLTIVASNLLIGGLIGLVIILIFEIPGSTANEHLDLHASEATTSSNYSQESLQDPDAMPHPHNTYVEETDGERKPPKTPKFWTTHMSLYVKGFLWLTLGYMFYIATTTIGEATVASFGASWEVRFEPLLVLMVASCLAGHYSLIRHDMHVILDTVAPYMFLPFFVMTGAALKLDMVVDTLPLMSLYVCLRFGAVFIACYLGLADEMRKLSSDPWAGEFAVTIVAAVVVNQIIGPVLCAFGLRRAGESRYERRAETQPVEDGVDGSDNDDSVNGGRALQSRLPSNTTQDPSTLLPFHEVKSAVIVGEDEVAFEIALELSLCGAHVKVPLLDKEHADKWQTISETIFQRSAKGELIQYKNKAKEHEREEHMEEMSSAFSIKRLLHKLRPGIALYSSSICHNLHILNHISHDR
ncbi:unnamed protein product [Peronospora destructor]|uniref:Cation/H+ exchanger domain-containing protein n=1 Tax=Peronospora destructor TaxID=86335 RepID=A0AAV0UJF9_9STRA|nr:unnamed protein product [Peronospora destructor]